MRIDGVVLHEWRPSMTRVNIIASDPVPPGWKSSAMRYIGSVLESDSPGTL
jgi:hypothetical protein